MDPHVTVQCIYRTEYCRTDVAPSW
jgi:hypothetical protein